VSNAADQNEFLDFSKTSTRRSFLLLGVGAIIGLGIAGYGLFTAAGTATRTVPPEYIAIVNQRPIYRSDYLAQLQTTYVVSYEEATQEQKQKVVEDMINEELLVQRGLEADLASYDPDVRTALVAGVELQMYADVVAKQPTEEELKAYYDQHRDQYSSLGVWRLRDLEINTVPNETPEALSQRTQAVLATLRAGKNIDGVMQQYKLRDSLHLQQGGNADLGDIYEFAAEANLPAAVYAAATKLQTGEVSEPISVIGEGTHIVVMVKRRNSEPQGFEEVRSRVWTDIKNEEQEKVRTSTLNYLRSKSEILVGKE
jgi:PPIC-type PPIASE domain